MPSALIKFIMLNVIILSVIMLSVFMLNVRHFGACQKLTKVEKKVLQYAR